jgi:hypothetical protein
MRSFASAIVGAAAAMLSGCLVSDAPMFDAASASAAPLQPGRYEACSEPPEPEDGDCQLLDVRRREDGAYEFQVAQEDQIVVRFHEVDAATYAAQFEDDDGDGYQYYWARRDGETLLLAMIWCEDFPPKMRDAMKADGLIAQEGDSSTCTALKREAVVAAVKAYRDGVVVSDDGVRLTPSP